MSSPAIPRALLLGLSGLAALPAHAAFVEDSKASLTLRNFYINQDTRNQDSPSAKEWGQGFIFNYSSGFTEGTVGFGVDALGMWGVRLDSGGRDNKAGRSRTPGTVFPTQGDGSAEDEFGQFGLTGKVRVSKTVLQIGTLMPKIPVLVYNDGRMLPQVFEGGQITSNEIDGLTLLGGKLEHAKERASTNAEGMSMGGASQDSNAFYYAGADYKLGKSTTLQYYYGNLEDFYKQHFLGLVNNTALPLGSLKTDLRYFDSSSDGRNGSAAGRAAGYTANGYWGAGDSDRNEVDNRLWSAMFTWSLAGHSLGLGYQASNGESDFARFNEGQGESVYLITNAQIGKFASAGERTWVGSYAYDFGKLGVQGLKASLVYYKGDDIDAAGSDHREWERDLRMDYVIPEGKLKGLGFTWRHATLRGNDAADRDEHRVMISYTLPLL